MPQLGNCDVCGAPLAAVNGGIGCSDCGAPARFHPLNKQFYSHQMATAEQKLSEINGQMARLGEQKAMWEGKLAEAKSIMGDGPVKPMRKPIVPPQMLQPGQTVVPKEAITAAEAINNMGRPLQPAMAGAAVAVSPAGDAAFLDTNAEPLMAKAKNAAGQAILDRNKRR